MGGAGFGQPILAFLLLVIMAVPISKILRRAGYSGWWTIMAFLPVINIIGLWAFAFASWPALERNPE